MSDDVYDEDGMRERADVRESEARRRERDRAEARAEEAGREAGRDGVRADLREGRISREDFARLAREAGISVREVAATLREHRPAQAAPAPLPSPSAAARSLATAATAKAKGVEELRRGETAEAAATFSRAAELAAAARAEPGSGSDGVSGEALRLQAAAELNLSLCQLKLCEWEAAAAAGSRALAAGGDEAATCTKAFYRRAKAHLGQGQRDAALADLRSAARLSPQDGEVRRELARVEAEAEAEAEEAEAEAATVVGEATVTAAEEAEAEAVAEAPAVAIPAPERRSYCYLELAVDGRPVGHLDSNPTCYRLQP